MIQCDLFMSQLEVTKNLQKRSQKTSRIARYLIFSSSCQGSHTEKTKHLWSFYCQGSPFRKNFLFQKPSKFGKRTEMELRRTRPISKHEKLLGIHIFAWKKVSSLYKLFGISNGLKCMAEFLMEFQGVFPGSLEMGFRCFNGGVDFFFKSKC